MTAREETVLPPIDPSITDENDWWEFTLYDVKVLRPGKMLYANLLEASDENPVQVIGCLELKQNQEHLVLNQDNSSNRIIIDDVTHYAYGQTEDRSVEIWVAGKAGWYNISPAKGYLPTFNRMVQAVDMLYFLMDRHLNSKKQLNPTFKSLCEQYVYHTHGDCETGEQSAEVFAQHAPFLLRCMIEDDDDVDWKKTNVFVHLRRFSPDVYKELMAQQSPNSENGEGDEEPVATTPRHDPSGVTKSQVDAVYQLIQDLKEEGHLAKRRLHLDLLTERLSERFSFGNEDARKIISARADAVVAKLDEEEGFRWSRYVIHRELKRAASEHTTLPPALLTPLQPLDDSDDDMGRTQKSVLRPKIASVSNKLMGKRNRNAVVNQPTESLDAENDEDVENEVEDTQMEEVDTPSKSRGHELIRTPFASTQQQSAEVPNTPSAATSQSAATSLLKSVLSADAPQTPALASSVPQWTSEVSLGHPFDEPDIWTCRMPGCTKTLTSKGEERKKEIADHAGEHDWEVQMRVELVESERRMHSTMPVSNLMNYLVDQHLQQKRTAFPELYPLENGNENGLAIESVHTEMDGLASSPSNQLSAELQNPHVNGHAT